MSGKETVMASAHYSSDEEVKPSDNKPKLKQKNTILDYFKRKPKQEKGYEEKQDKRKANEKKKETEKPVESDQQKGMHTFYFIQSLYYRPFI